MIGFPVHVPSARLTGFVLSSSVIWDGLALRTHCARFADVALACLALGLVPALVSIPARDAQLRDAVRRTALFAFTLALLVRVAMPVPSGTTSYVCIACELLGAAGLEASRVRALAG